MDTPGRTGIVGEGIAEEGIAEGTAAESIVEGTAAEGTVGMVVDFAVDFGIAWVGSAIPRSQSA